MFFNISEYVVGIANVDVLADDSPLSAWRTAAFKILNDGCIIFKLHLLCSQLLKYSTALFMESIKKFVRSLFYLRKKDVAYDRIEKLMSSV